MDTELHLGGKAFPRQDKAWTKLVSGASMEILVQLCRCLLLGGSLGLAVLHPHKPGGSITQSSQSHHHTATTCWLWDLAVPASRVGTPLGSRQPCLWPCSVVLGLGQLSFIWFPAGLELWGCG